MPVQLPPEIIEDILSYLTPQPREDIYEDSEHDNELRACQNVLARVTRASRLLQRVAEPLLYRYLHSPNLAPLDTLCRRPELCEHVRHVVARRGSNLGSVKDCAAVVRLLHEHIRPVMRERYWPALDQFLEHLFDNGIDFNTTRY